MIKSDYINFLKLSEQYLHTSKLIIEKMIENQNRNMVIQDYPISREEYMEKTKWSDFNTLTPTLFLFYHGLELLIKGLVLFQKDKIEGTHDLNVLLNKLDEEIIEEELVDILKKYINLSDNTYIAKFIRNNAQLDKGSKRPSLLLRYPEFKDGTINYDGLRYSESKIISQLKRTVGDIKKIKKLVYKTISIKK